jgi:hypothetical protein
MLNINSLSNPVMTDQAWNSICRHEMSDMCVEFKH